jgi:hypothetical protein
MNHLSRKKKLYGAGKKPKVKPAVLLPPKIGDFQFGASFSYVETLDLISDGPIEGLVDSKGSLLRANELSRGIYMDGTPVSVGIDTEEYVDSNFSAGDGTAISKSISSFTNINTDGKGGASISEKIINASYQPIELNFQNLVGNNNAFLFRSDNDIFEQIPQAPPETEISNPKVLVKTSNSLSFSMGDVLWYYYQMLFTNNTTVSNSDFFVSFNNTSLDYLGSDFGYAANFVFSEKFSDVEFGPGNAAGVYFFQKIIDAWNGYKTSNVFMRDLINQKMTKVFGANWVSLTAKNLHIKFFVKRSTAGYFAIYYPDRDILSDIGDVQFPPDQAKDVTVIPTNQDGDYSEITSKFEYTDLLIPIFNSSGQLDQTAPILGASFIFIDKNRGGEFFPELWEEKVLRNYDIGKFLKELKKVTKLTISTVKNFAFNEKYNYNNVLIEYRRGTEEQSPFRYFNKVYIDKNVNKNVYGPFKKGQVQRIVRDISQNKDNFSMDSVNYAGPTGYSNNPIMRLVGGVPINEGSSDSLRETSKRNIKQNVSNWNDQNKRFILEEKAAPATYYIYNPNVSEVFVTLKIDSLFDTVEQNYNNGEKDFKIGDKLPAILNVEIEVGKVLSNGTEQRTSTRVYRISALIEGPTLLDIGNPSNMDDTSTFKHVRNVNDIGSPAGDISTPFKLPIINNYSINNSFSSPEKRYVKVNKLSTETFSILISKEVTFYKVTEIIPVNLSYPFSAIVGTKIDSKTFSSLPSRSFDARLKLVQVPENYFPTQEGYRRTDKRYYDKKSELNSASLENKSIYQGDWNGSFKMAWTDNPAWILYDLLTNTRYGLGRHIEVQDVNKWELYKIGRFCDAVDADGYFEGVPDGRGGLEPRYSCNIIFKSDEKVFDSIQLISKLFRGQTFFRASEVSFVDERIKSPIATFSNNNVKDGYFSYSNLRRDQQFNTVEVSYLDRFENFTPKVEVVEDEEDIRSRGVFKKRVDGLGVTSRSMARRIGQHLIYRTIKENQRVAFTSGLEALLCQPGDLIIVDDDLKNEISNFGKVLNVDVDNEYIQLSGPYSSGSMTGILTVYNPTGESSVEDLGVIATTKRARTDTFTITDSLGIYTGLYNFSGYQEGYEEDDIEDSDKFSEYALYTGTGDNIIYFDTGATGWVFATGLEVSDIDYINKETTHTLASLNTGFVSTYDNSDSDKRTTPEINISGKVSGDLNNLNSRGILESEIALNSQPQIVTLNVAGQVGTGDGFSFVSGVDSPDYLQFIKLGSPYRFDLKDADDVLYKIDSIRENSPNEYLVSAAKFETGKFSLIENNISLEKRENTYDYNVATQIGDITYTGLSAPENLSITTGAGTETDTFFISGDWDEVVDKDSYEVILRYPNGSDFSSTGILSENVKFDNLSSIGNYALSVRAIGSSAGSTKTIDSNFSTLKKFILYTELEEFDKSFINKITFR